MSRSEKDKRTVYIISGPTAVGKSLIAYYLAKRIGGEIVNCDSVQLYKYMDIGSAKPSDKEMKAVRHHLYSIVDPAENMTVASYRKLALEAIDGILARGRTPIVCGGTGLYLNSILYDMDFGGQSDDGERRKELEDLAEERGGDYVIRLTSNGEQPAGPIRETGGLKSLRELTEYIGGTMELSYSPVYTVTLILPKEVPHAYKRIDRG